jgi:DNA topoisomerase-2
MNSTTSNTIEYDNEHDQHTHREHILELPDTYIGSVETETQHRWVYNSAAGKMEWRSVAFCPGFLKIFDEILVNALDHRVRANCKIAAGETDIVPVKHIDVVINSQQISVRNDGEGVPVKMNAKTNLWVPDMIFGHLLTSSNYNKTQEKIVGGKNGYGAKLTNIYSTEFTVETVDTSVKKKYIQTWRDNMIRSDDPKITSASCKAYTEIRYKPDLKRFVWSDDRAVPSEIPADMLAVLATRVIDAAACSGKECKVTLNGTPVTTNTFPKYINLYVDEKEDAKQVAFEVAGERWEVGAVLARELHGDNVPKEKHVSFVNGIATRRGGNHVNYVVDKALDAFCEVAKRKAKLTVTPNVLKDSVIWFINSTIVNPAFDTQTKETLTSTSKNFGSLPEISPKFIDQLIKIGLLQEAQILVEAKNVRDAKRTDGKKKSVVRGIPKLEDALWAGTAKSGDCTLILTEGDSAATTAISGLKVVGRERYGVFPLRGKVLNVKDVSPAKKAANEEIAHIKQILGLETGKVYTSVSELRYGRIMIMTDQDVDGSHIKGLLMNLFHTDWPSLLQLDFICCLMTPLLKVTKGAQTLCFYSESEYETWRDAQADLRGWKTKYYKGLGTSTATEAREYFANMNTVEYNWDAVSNEAIDLAFNKKRSDDRKGWLADYDRSRHLPVKAGGVRVGYGDFIHNELIHFSSADNVRSIPHIMDGLKPSQRKILWSALKRNLTSEIRVAQLAGYVSETAAYHHGETSLTGAIVGMAQNFVGSNNMNLLSPNGQFGTRLMGGKDAASARYIHTQLMQIVRAVIKKEDDAVLAYTDDDGTPVEPEAYMPVVPLALINGISGIGTGFSSDVCPYNPADLVRAIRARLTGTESDLSSVSLAPWWFGFRGEIQSENGRTWVTRGIYEWTDHDSCTIRIRELPVGKWTKDYKEDLDKILAEQEELKSEWTAACTKARKEGLPAPAKPPAYLKGYQEAYNDIDCDFILEMDPDYYHEARAYPKEFEKRFKLTSTFHTSNMVMFDVDGKLRRFESVGAIMERFYGTRLGAYGKRKAHELGRLESEITELEARLLFVKAVVSGRLVVANVDDTVLLAGLRDLGVPALSGAADDLKGYEYLLRMRIDRLKAAAVAELEREVAVAREKHAALTGTSCEALWLADLDAFATAWEAYAEERRDIYAAAAAESAAGAGEKKKAAAPRKPRAPKSKA